MDFPVPISVVMPTYNTDIPMLREAVESILNQTFGDFEFLLIDDGSTDQSVAYLDSISDPRVRLLRNPTNIGVAKSLNRGFRAAKGKYIARMDADDVSLPERFEKQYAFMEAHPEVIVCGSVSGVIDAHNNLLKEKTQAPPSHKEYLVRMLFMNPGPLHPTAFFRRETLLQHHVEYDERLLYSQDYGMWATLREYGVIHIMDEVLLNRRMHEKQITSARREKVMECDKLTQKKLLTDLLGEVSDQEVDLHYAFSTGYQHGAAITPEISRWYDRLIQANKGKGLYDQKTLENRVLTIKKQLIRNTIGKGLPLPAALGLFFRYLPLPSALKAIAGAMCWKMDKKEGPSQ